MGETLASLIERAIFLINEGEELGGQFELVDGDTNFEFRYPPDIAPATLKTLQEGMSDRLVSLAILDSLLHRAGKPAKSALAVLFAPPRGEN